MLQRFFYVKQGVKIAGKAYLPCICYTLTPALSYTIETLAAENKAVITLEKVVFQSGKPLEKKEKEFKQFDTGTKASLKIKEINEAVFDKSNHVHTVEAKVEAVETETVLDDTDTTKKDRKNKKGEF